MSAERKTKRRRAAAPSGVPGAPRRAARVRASSPVTEDDLRRLAAGEHDALWRCLGAQRVDGGAYAFSVWAPNAEAVSVVGDFNGWDAEAAPLTRLGASGVWTGIVEGVAAGALYKFHLRPRGRRRGLNKADPLAFRAQIPPATASVAWQLEFEWTDEAWIASRAERQGRDRPMSIYELHLGSWRRDPGRPDALPSYEEIGDALIPYLEETGFTHVELLPLTEHPFYGSWGYQGTGYFAATARYGTPQELMRLIDRLHGAGIGVILDWVPSHFPADAHGLGQFDGTRLYEYPDPRVGYQPDWKSYVFNFGRPEVRSFLLSSARFWIEMFHVDALRVDAVASMLYLDYSRGEGQWIANKYGGRENLEAISFLRRLNEVVHQTCPGALTIAEESTAWPMVSRPTWVGGLGFDMKWDMGWMHDTLEYMRLDPVHRKFHHDKLTFRMIYAWSESFVLPLSHDEVVHGKGSLVAKMSGNEWRKFATLRALYGLMWAQPGKKLLFMGGEFGPWSEWNHDRGLEWHVLDHRSHAGLRRWVADLNRLYRERPALHRFDFDPAGFEWVDCHDADKSVVSMLRRDRAEDADAEDLVLAVFNFTPVPRHHYRVGVPRGGRWRELLNSDAETYWGGGMGNLGGHQAVPMRAHGRPWSLDLLLPPLSATFYRREADDLSLPPTLDSDPGA